MTYRRETIRGVLVGAWMGLMLFLSIWAISSEVADRHCWCGDAGKGAEK